MFSYRSFTYTIQTLESIIFHVRMHAVPDLRFVVWFAVVAPPAFQTSMCLTNAQHLHNERGARSCCHTVGRALQHHSIVLWGGRTRNCSCSFGRQFLGRMQHTLVSECSIERHAFGMMLSSGVVRLLWCVRFDHIS